jgi:hypothetical protein
MAPIRAAGSNGIVGITWVGALMMSISSRSSAGALFPATQVRYVQTATPETSFAVPAKGRGCFSGRTTRLSDPEPPI